MKRGLVRGVERPTDIVRREDAAEVVSATLVAVVVIRNLEHLPDRELEFRFDAADIISHGEGPMCRIQGRPG